MGFNLGGFVGGMAEGIQVGIEKEEERINMLADKAFDQYTQDYRDNKAKREAARKAAEAYMFQLKDAGYDIATSAHIARYGQGAVESAVAKAKEHGDTHDINTLYGVAPDPSTKDFTEGQWLDMIVGSSTTKIDPSSYIGKSGGAADYRTMFGPSARDVFNERVKSTNMREAIPTTEGTFGTMTPLRLTSKEVKTYNSFEAILTNLAIEKSNPSLTPDKKAALETRFKEVLTAKRSYDAELAEQGKQGFDFSKQSRKSIIESYITSALPNIAQSIDDKLHFAFEGNEAGYMTGMNQALINLETDFKDINDEMMANSIKSTRNNFDVFKRGYVNKQIQMFNSTDNKDKSKFIPTTNTGTIPTQEEVVKGVENRQYKTGSVIIYKNTNGDTQIAIWTGTSLIGATSSYNIN